MGVFSVMLILLFSLPSLWAKGPAANRKGNGAYRKGNYEEAMKEYGKAAEALPGDRTIAYNQGTSLLKQKKYDEALKSLLAGAGDPRRDVKNAALYNAGNALVEAQKLPEALSAYRQSILADPNDMDAKFNYELARRKLQQGQDQNDENKDDENKDRNEDKNQQGQDNQDQQQNEDQEQKDSDQQDQEQQQNADENEDQAQQNPDQPQPEDGDDQQGSEDQKPQPAARLSREQAERLLDALKDNEMEMIKARLKSKRKKNVEKDW